MPRAVTQGGRTRDLSDQVYLFRRIGVPAKTSAQQAGQKGALRNFLRSAKFPMTLEYMPLSVISRLRAECLEFVSRLIKQEPE